MASYGGERVAVPVVPVPVFDPDALVVLIQRLQAREHQLFARACSMASAIQTGNEDYYGTQDRGNEVRWQLDSDLREIRADITLLNQLHVTYQKQNEANDVHETDRRSPTHSPQAPV